MTPASSSQGHRRAALGRKRNGKAPSVTGGAQKIHVRGIQRTRNLFGSPAQGGLKNKGGAYHSCAIETAHNDPRKVRDAFRIDQRRVEHKQTERPQSVCHFTIADTIAEVPCHKSSLARKSRPLARASIAKHRPVEGDAIDRVAIAAR